LIGSNCGRLLSSACSATGSPGDIRCDIACDRRAAYAMLPARCPRTFAKLRAATDFHTCFGRQRAASTRSLPTGGPSCSMGGISAVATVWSSGMTHGPTSVFNFASSSSHRGGKGPEPPSPLVLGPARSRKLASGSCISPAPSTKPNASSVPPNKAGLTSFAAT
jgi:hypothetical protein